MNRCCAEFSVGPQEGTCCPYCGSPARLELDGTLIGKLLRVESGNEGHVLEVANYGGISTPSVWTLGIDGIVLAQVELNQAKVVFERRDGLSLSIDARYSGSAGIPFDALVPDIMCADAGGAAIAFDSAGSASIELSHVACGDDSIVLGFRDAAVPTWKITIEGPEDSNRTAQRLSGQQWEVPLEFPEGVDTCTIVVVFSRGRTHSVRRHIRVKPGNESYEFSKEASRVVVSRDGKANFFGDLNTKNVPSGTSLRIVVEIGRETTEAFPIEVRTYGDATPVKSEFLVSLNVSSAIIRIIRNGVNVGRDKIPVSFPRKFDCTNALVALDFGTSRSVLGIKGAVQVYQWRFDDWPARGRWEKLDILKLQSARYIQFASREWYRDVGTAESDARAGIVPSVFESDSELCHRFTPGSAKSWRISRLKQRLFRETVAVNTSAGHSLSTSPMKILESGIADLFHQALDGGAFAAALRTESRTVAAFRPWDEFLEVTKGDEVVLGVVLSTRPVAWSSEQASEFERVLQRAVHEWSPKSDVQLLSDEACLPALSFVDHPDWVELLVVDLGGGTLDVACLKRDPSRSRRAIALTALGGKSDCGGEAICDALDLRTKSLLGGLLQQHAPNFSLCEFQRNADVIRSVTRRLMRDPARWESPDALVLGRSVDVEELLTLHVVGMNGGRTPLSTLAERGAIAAGIAALTSCEFETAFESLVREWTRIVGAVMRAGNPEGVLLTGAASRFRPFRACVEKVLPKVFEGATSPKLALVDGLLEYEIGELRDEGIRVPFGIPLKHGETERFHHLWSVGDSDKDSWKCINVDKENPYSGGGQLSIYRLHDHAVQIGEYDLETRDPEAKFAIQQYLRRVVVGSLRSWVRFGGRDRNWRLALVSSGYDADWIAAHSDALATSLGECSIDGASVVVIASVGIT